MPLNKETKVVFGEGLFHILPLRQNMLKKLPLIMLHLRSEKVNTKFCADSFCYILWIAPFTRSLEVTFAKSLDTSLTVYLSIINR